MLAPIKDCRYYLAQQLHNDIVNQQELLNAEGLFPYRTAKFNNRSPLVVVTTHNIVVEINRANAAEAHYNFLLIGLATMTTAAQEQQAEDYLDDIDNAIIATSAKTSFRDNAYWRNVSLRNEDRDTINVQGQNRRRCRWILTVTPKEIPDE